MITQEHGMNEGCERYDESILSKHFSKRNSAWPESTTVILIHAPEDLQLTRRCHGFLDTATTSPWTWRGYFVPQKTA